MQTIEAAGKTPDLPPLGAGSHLVGYLFEAGPVSHVGMGPVPLAWSDMQAWQQATGIELAPWQVCALRRLSGEYLAMQHDAADPDCPPPYSPRPVHDRRADVSRAIGAIFGARSRAKPKQGL